MQPVRTVTAAAPRVMPPVPLRVVHAADERIPPAPSVVDKIRRLRGLSPVSPTPTGGDNAPQTATQDDASIPPAPSLIDRIRQNRGAK